jgi:cell division septum initiation protein DivIVA
MAHEERPISSQIPLTQDLDLALSYINANGGSPTNGGSHAATREAHRPTAAAPDQADPAALSGMLVGAGDRIREMLQVTDKTAQEMMEEANVAAQRCFREAYERSERLAGEQMDKLASVSEELLSQAATIQQKVYELNQAVEQSTAALASEFGIEKAPAPRGRSVADRERVPQEPREHRRLNGESPRKRGRMSLRKKRSGHGTVAEAERSRAY